MKSVCAGLIVFLCVAAQDGDDYLKDGKLTHPLKVVQLQSGFAGSTGTEYTIEPDGTWTTASVFNKKITPKDKGKLTAKELEGLAGLLAKNELAKLPAKSGKQPGANPHTITIEFGKTRATLVGQMQPKMDPNDAASAESRFAGIVQGVRGLLKSEAKKE
jgi:hypothetical protein